MASRRSGEPSPLRTLHVLDHSLPVRDGYAFRSHAILRAQRARGWQPFVVTSPKHHESDVTSASETEIHGVPVFRTRRVESRGPVLLPELAMMRALAVRLRQVAEEVKPHVIHAHSPTLDALPALRVGRRLGIPVVYEVRASWEDAAVSMGKYTEGSTKYRLSRGVETWAARRADHLTVLCEGLRADFVKRGLDASRVTPIPNGVDVESFSEAPRDVELARELGLDGRHVIGFIGSFFEWEGLDLLVDAMGELAPSRADVALLLVGSGDKAEAVRAQVRTLGLDQRVVLTGGVPQSQIGRYYSIIDVLAYPRRSMRLTELVTPLKPLEAMAMSKALVASDVGGHRELIADGRTGVLFQKESVAALAAVLGRLVDDAGLRRRLGSEGRRWVCAERTWERTTEPYAGIYRRLAGDVACV